VLEGPYLVDGRVTAQAVGEYTRLIEKLDELRLFAADRLLALYNDTWLDDDIGQVDRNGFAARLSNPAITLMDEIGAATVLFGDGGLFAGHTIDVSVDHGTPTHAGILG